MRIPAKLRVPALAASLIGAGFLTGRPDDAEFYRSLKQAPFAPPSWAFGPAWVVAKSGWAYAVVRGAATTAGRPRRVLAGLAVADAVIYVSFNYVYFRRKSLRGAAVWTVADAAITAVALPLLAREDPKAARALAPQAAWLTLATPTAIYQAAANEGSS